MSLLTATVPYPQRGIVQVLSGEGRKIMENSSAQCVFIDTTDEKTWRAEWTDDQAGIIHRASSTKGFTDLTISWRWRDPGRVKVWNDRQVQLTPPFGLYGLTRPAATYDEFLAVVQEYLETAPTVGALNGGRGGYY